MFNNFFDNVIVRGQENIPWDKPIVLTPNHQNALMDSLIFVAWKNFQPVWLARGDIFNKVTTPILRFFKIMPIYRIRDGIKALGKNSDIFEDTSRILQKGKCLAVFPEAGHTPRRRHQSIKKGVPRIIFKAFEDTDFDLDIHIQPVGIYYEHYHNYKHNVIINFGKPIPAKKYITTYKESLYQANKDIQEDIEKALKSLSLHIPSEENYDFYEEIRELGREIIGSDTNLNHKEPFTALFLDKEAIHRIYKFEDTDKEYRLKEFEELKKLNEDYQAELKKYKLRNENIILDKKTRLTLPILGLILTFPIFLFGAISHYIPFKFPDNIIKNKIKDTQFWSSFNVLFAILFVPIYYIAFGFGLTIWFSGISLFVMIALFVLSGDWAFNWYRKFKKYRALLKAENLRRNGEGIFEKKSKLVKKLEKMLKVK
jgi:1-acyl-sn-glycerol-3-phosphate acyltransferase